MEIDLKRLKQLVTIAKLGSFSKAAEELHISQPALSRSIAGFESRFGIRIFDRGRTGVVLTPLGTLAIAEAETLLRQARTLGHNLGLYGSGDAGRVALGMAPLIASMVLPRLSSHFLACKPKLRVQTSVKPAELLAGELLDDKLEVLFCSAGTFPDGDELAVRTIGRMRIGLVVRAAHPLAGAGVVTRAQMTEFPLLSGRELPESSTPCGTVICDNYHILREVIHDCDALWVTSPQFVQQEIRCGRLTLLAVEDSPLPEYSDVCEVRRAGRTASPTSAAIGDFVGRFFSALCADNA